MKMSFTYRSIFMQIKLIFIWMVSHLHSFCNRQLGNGLLFYRVNNKCNYNNWELHNELRWYLWYRIHSCNTIQICHFNYIARLQILLVAFKSDQRMFWSRGGKWSFKKCASRRILVKGCSGVKFFCDAFSESQFLLQG